MKTYLLGAVIVANLVMLSACTSTSVSKSDTTCVNDYTFACWSTKKYKLESRKTQVAMSKAFEVYLDTNLDKATRNQNAISMLEQIKPTNDYDIAVISKTLGHMAFARGKGFNESDTRYALSLYVKAVSLRVLNAKDHAETLKMIAYLYSKLDMPNEALLAQREYEDFLGDEYLLKFE